MVDISFFLYTRFFKDIFNVFQVKIHFFVIIFRETVSFFLSLLLLFKKFAQCLTHGQTESRVPQNKKVWQSKSGVKF